MENVRKFPKKPESPQVPPFYDFGAFTIDTAKHLLLRDGEPVPVTPKVFDLLLTLARNSGAVLLKDELMKQLWPDTVVEEGNLNRNISSLRKALGEAPDEHRYVVTLPGRGYRFVAEVRERWSEYRAPLAAGSEAAPAPPGPVAAEPASPLEASAPAAAPIGRSAEAAAGKSGPRRRVSRAAWAVIVAVVVLGGGAALWVGTRARPDTRAKGSKVRIDSLAVLPLDNLSGDPKQDYFAAGITDDLTTELAHIRGLKVVSRTSASQFQSAHKSLPEIARALGVTAVIEGSVVRDGNRVRITTQLIDAANDRHLWAGTYEDSIDEIIALQDRAARDVAREVQAAVEPDEAAADGAATGEPTGVNRQAYDDYLKGLYVWDRRDPRTYDRAIQEFTRATAEDPHFAAAFANLADVYVLIALNGEDGQRFAPLGREAALKALEQDSSSAEAHAALAAVSAVFSWDWATANREFQQAIKLNPNYSTAHQWYADFYLIPELKLDEASREIATAKDLDPLSPIMLVDDGFVSYVRGDYPAARRQYERALAVDPDFVQAHFRMEGWYLAQGRDADFAREIAENMRRNEKGNSLTPREIDAGYAREGLRGVARAVLVADQHKGGPWGIAAAEFFGLLGDTARACAALKGSALRHEPSLLYLNVDPAYAALRRSPCYQEISRTVGLPQLPSTAAKSVLAAAGHR